MRGESRSRRPTLLALSLVAAMAVTVAAGRGPSFVNRVVIDGPISPAVADRIKTSLDQASDSGAAALVLQLDTPGGLLNSTKTIVKELLASPVPVIVYVGPGGGGATSAGVFITLAGHIAAMAPGTTIGAAHPVGGQGQDIQGDMREKVENYAASFVGSIAERRGRNVEWAEKAVRESVSITETEALELGVIDLLAPNIDDLIAGCSGREVELGGKTVVLELGGVLDDEGRARVVDIEPTLRQKVLGVITDPNIAYLLMMAGMLGLYMEFSNPGTVFPGVAGAICLLLALLAAQVLPISSIGVLLIMLGMAFLLAELFMPSFGVLGLGGIIAITLGSLFLYTPESGIHVDLSYIVATVVMFTAAVAAVVGLLVRDRRQRATTGAEGLIGERGISVTKVSGSGKVKVHGEFWNASSSRPISKNRPVRVESVDGLAVRVREEEEQ